MLSIFYNFINYNSLNFSLILIIIFTLLQNKSNNMEKTINSTFEFIESDSRVIDYLDLNNSDKIYIIRENKNILGVVGYDDIYLAAMSGKYYSYTKELLTERT